MIYYQHIVSKENMANKETAKKREGGRGGERERVLNIGKNTLLAHIVTMLEAKKTSIAILL